MTQPIETLMESVKWEACETTPVDDDGFLPFATHHGILEIGEIKLRCYRLNNGMAIINAEDLKALFPNEIPRIHSAMSNEVQADAGVTLRPTLSFRWLETSAGPPVQIGERLIEPHSRELQQAWWGDDGVTYWRAVPTVKE